MSLKQPTSISRAHRNLDDRLQPFWSSLVPNQSIQIGISIHTSGANEATKDTTHHENVIIKTDTQGYFQQQIDISAESVWRATASPQTSSGRANGAARREELPLWLDITASVLDETDSSPYLRQRDHTDTCPSAIQSKDIRDLPGRHNITGDAYMISANSAKMRVSDPGGVRILSDIVSGPSQRFVLL